MEIKIEHLTFKRYQEFWLANFYLNNTETTFEVWSENLDKVLITKIADKISDKTFLPLITNSISVLQPLSLAFWSDSKNNIFSFSGIVIDDYHTNLNADFKLCFHCAGPDHFSDYANWFVGIKDFRVSGCWRQQI